MRAILRRGIMGCMLAVMSCGLSITAIGCSHKEAPAAPSRSQANSAPPEVQQEFKNAPH